MKIAKILNNNVVSALDEKDRETIVIGRGVGFQKHSGDEIDAEKIEKVFCLPDQSKSQFEKLVGQIPYEYVNYTDEIVKHAAEVLGKKLDQNIYITLTDHLHFAVKRYQQGISFQNELLWEIKKFYSKEYEIGIMAIRLLKEREGIELSVDEAAFIALHIVNAEMDGSGMGQALSMPGLIKDMVNIVRYTFRMEFDEDDLSYERFITHLKFFVQRAVKKTYYPAEENGLYEVYKKKEPKSYDCARKIKKYMEEKTGTEVTDEEMLYLTVHISRIIRRNGAERHTRE